MIVQVGLANFLNVKMDEYSYNFSRFTNAEAYADANVLAEADSFPPARAIFESIWKPNSETEEFFATEVKLRDLSTYRETLHYQAYIKQYLIHTTPGFGMN